MRPKVGILDLRLKYFQHSTNLCCIFSMKTTGVYILTTNIARNFFILNHSKVASTMVKFLAVWKCLIRKRTRLKREKVYNSTLSDYIGKFPRNLQRFEMRGQHAWDNRITSEIRILTVLRIRSTPTCCYSRNFWWRKLLIQ